MNNKIFLLRLTGIRKLVCATMIFLCGLLSFYCLLASAHAQDTPIDRIVAVVNDHVITLSQFNHQYDKVKQQMLAAQAPMPPDAELRKQVLNRLIDQQLQLQLATSMNVTVSDSALDQALTDIAKQHNITLAQLPAALQSQGISYTEFRNDIRDNMIISQLAQRAVTDRIHIVDSEINARAKLLATQPSSTTTEYRLQDVLFALPDNPTPAQIQAQQQLANTMLTQLKDANVDAIEVANVAGSKGAAVRGTDLDWRKPSDLPEIFAKQLPNMKPGGLLGPFRAPNGFHIVKLQGVRGDTPNQPHYSTETHVRHILIKTNALNTVTDVKLRLIDLRNRITHGESFADIAQNSSEDPVSASKGGDLGWMKPGMLDHDFEQAMDKLKPNEVSQPVLSQFGWHLIQVLERRQVEDSHQSLMMQAKQQLYQRKFEDAAKDWVNQLRSQAYIRKMLDKVHKKARRMDTANDTVAAVKTATAATSNQQQP